MDPPLDLALSGALHRCGGRAVQYRGGDERAVRAEPRQQSEIFRSADVATGDELDIGHRVPDPGDQRSVEMTARLRVELEKTGAKGVTAVEMEVEENIGQAAVYREEW